MSSSLISYLLALALTLSPANWLKPRLRSLFVVFGVADLALVLVSVIGWYVFFDISFHAQQNHILLEYRRKPLHKLVITIGDQNLTQNQSKLLPLKEDRNEEEDRLQRIVRACGLASGVENEIDQNFATPSALIGASMGGYAIIGSLLISVSRLHNAFGKKVISTVCLAGEGICTVFLLISVTYLLANDGLCPTEYYFESFQPVYHIYIFSLIFIASYKTYEVTVIIFYLMEQSKLADKETAGYNAFKQKPKSVIVPQEVEESVKEWDVDISYEDGIIIADNDDGGDRAVIDPNIDETAN